MKTETLDILKGTSMDRLFKAASLLNKCAAVEAERERQFPGYSAAWKWTVDDLGRMVSAMEHGCEGGAGVLALGTFRLDSDRWVPDLSDLGTHFAYFGRTRFGMTQSQSRLIGQRFVEQGESPNE